MKNLTKISAFLLGSMLAWHSFVRFHDQSPRGFNVSLVGSLCVIYCVAFRHRQKKRGMVFPILMLGSLMAWSFFVATTNSRFAYACMFSASIAVVIDVILDYLYCLQHLLKSKK